LGYGDVFNPRGVLWVLWGTTMGRAGRGYTSRTNLSVDRDMGHEGGTHVDNAIHQPQKLSFLAFVIIQCWG